MIKRNIDYTRWITLEAHSAGQNKITLEAHSARPAESTTNTSHCFHCWTEMQPFMLDPGLFNQNMPESKLAALESAAPVMAKWTSLSEWPPASPVSATAAPAIAPAIALFFCTRTKTDRNQQTHAGPSQNGSLITD